jgi:zinc protease
MSLRRTLFAVPVLFISLLLSPLTCQLEAQGIRPVRAVEGIAEFQLENGLQVLLFPDVSRPTVTVNLTVFVGSRHEGYGEAGMAHLLEHMVFKGTPTHTDIPAMLKQRGAQFNGTTSLDRTNYYETMPSSDDNMEFALKLEADRMVNSLIRGEDLASEMTVVRNEFERGENSPQRVLMQRVMSAAYDWHNYGKSTIGNRADIERVPVESLRRFYQRFYQPDNAMLIIAGKFDPKKALEMTQKYFGAIPKPERVLDRTYTEEPAQDGERLVTVRRVSEVAMANVAYHIPSGAHPDFAAADVLSTVLASEPSGRLYEALVKRRIAASIYGFSYALHDPGVIMFGAEAAQGIDGASLLQAVIEALEGTAEKPFTDEEIERARQELLRQREISVADSQAMAIELSDWASQGDWRLFFLHRDRLEKVTAADVQRVAGSFLTRTNRTAGIFEPSETPQRTAVPATPELAAMIGDYKGREDIAQGEAFDASPLAIEARLERSKLASGIKVTLLPKKTRGESVDLRLSIRYGNLQTLKGLSTAASYLPEMLLRGTKTRTRQQISDELDKYRAQLVLTGDSGVLSVSLQTKRENVLPVLALLEDILRNPVFPPEELELLREEQIAAAGQQLTEPTAIARTEVQRKITVYPPDDPRYVATLEETVQRTRDVKIEQISKIYAELIGGGNGELSIVGDFDAAQVKPAADRLTANWTTKVPFERMPRESVNNDKGDYVEVNTPDKANAAYFAAMTLSMRDDHPDYPALAIGNFVLGAGGLSSRLANRVRQKEGLSYTVQSALQASPIDQRSVFYIFAISNPENSARVHEVIQEEIQKLLKDGVAEEEFQNAKTGYLREQEVRRSSDQSLAMSLETQAFVGRDMKFVADFEKKIQSLTVADVNAALRKHIKPERLYIVSAGDFAKVKAKQ